MLFYIVAADLIIPDEGLGLFWFLLAELLLLFYVKKHLPEERQFLEVVLRVLEEFHLRRFLGSCRSLLQLEP